eukprot:1031802-Amphidinium_carterae.1
MNTELSSVRGRPGRGVVNKSSCGQAQTSQCFSRFSEVSRPSGIVVAAALRSYCTLVASLPLMDVQEALRVQICGQLSYRNQGLKPQHTDPAI